MIPAEIQDKVIVELKGNEFELSTASLINEQEERLKAAFAPE